MKSIGCFLALALLLLGGGCATFQAAGQVQSGRWALLANEPEKALAHFQQAAQDNPDYIYSSARFQESVWTYVGRAHYALGNWTEARGSFERALAVYPDDPMAQLYLGLTLFRSGNETRGSQYLQQGLKSLFVWIDYLNYSRPDYAYWDPRREIRSEIAATLDRIGAERIDRGKELLASAEWVGRQMEEEIDKVRRDERRHFERERDHGFRRGLSIGTHIGF